MTTEHEREALTRKLRKRGIHDPRVLAAVARIPRELFLPEQSRHLAYDDSALPIGSGQTISQPYIVALMTQELGLEGNELVLEIGTGSGYQAAILSRLCRELVTVERIDWLSRQAQELLARLGHVNIDFRTGDGTLGCLERAPFDRIIVTAAAPQVPVPLYQQLKPQGRMIIPVGDESVQSLLAVTRRELEPEIREVCGCRFVKLIGQAGWPAE